MFKLFTSDDVVIISIVLFVLMLLACVWLVWFLLKVSKTKSAHYAFHSDNEYDGIQERDGATPYGMHIIMGLLILFSIWYVAFGYPLNHSHSPEWYQEETQEAQKLLDEKFADADEKTLTNIGESVYNNNCAVCHGIIGDGLDGLSANLVIYGTQEHIIDIIKTGSMGLQTLTPIMPPQFEAIGSDFRERSANAINISAYVMELQGKTPLFGDVEVGEEVYAKVCATCHSLDGSGRGLIGAFDNFASSIVEYGSQEYTENIIRKGKNGLIGDMPSFEEIGNLSPLQMKAVSFYVINELRLEPSNF